jgi:hypothetical protein
MTYVAFDVIFAVAAVLLQKIMSISQVFCTCLFFSKTLCTEVHEAYSSPVHISLPHATLNQGLTLLYIAIRVAFLTTVISYKCLAYSQVSMQVRH